MDEWDTIAPTKPKRQRKRTIEVPDWEPECTPQELEFIKLFLADPRRRASTAARAAGFPEVIAAKATQGLLKRPRVVAEIQKRTLPETRRLEIAADRVLQELAGIAYANVLDFGFVDDDGGFQFDLSRMDRVSAGGIASIKTRRWTVGQGAAKRSYVETELKLADRRQALEALGRHLKILGGDNAGPPLEPIRLVLEYAPPMPIPQQPLRINDLVKDDLP